MGTNISKTSPLQTVSVIDPGGFTNGNVQSSKYGGFNVYHGTVMSVDYATKRMCVNMNNTVIPNCVYIAGTIASLLGVASTQLPCPGSEVMCLFTPMQTFVIGTQPIYVTDTEALPNTATGDTEYNITDDFPSGSYEAEEDVEIGQALGYPTSNDVLPGEEEIGNNMAITLRFLSNILQMDASGLSLIEQCMLNDMVRIVDQYFVHHHCGGDTLIWNNGRCNYEDHFTSYPFEAAGLKDEHDPVAEQTEAGAGVYKLKDDDDPYDATGRWRKSTYIGFLGDMIHHWITNPTEAISNYAEGAARAGQIRTWVGSDGTLMVLAAGDIMIEATSYMVIPLILHKWDNPNINQAEILKDLNKEYLKIWGKDKKTYWRDMNASIWQMRQYLRYITIWHSLSRFRQMSEKEYCTIPTEKDSATGNKWADEADKQDAGIEIDEHKPYRTVFRCSPDGSMAMMTSGQYGMSSVVLNQGNIQLSAANNIEIKAGGTVSVTGNDVAVKAYRMLELVSLCGSIVQRARTAWKALCEAGRVWLKGDMPKDGYRAVSTAIPSEFKEYSVIIDSSQGKTLVHGAEGTTIGATSQGAEVTVEALNGGAVNVYGNTILVLADMNYLNHSSYHGVSTMYMGINTEIFNINDTFKYTASATLDTSAIVRAGGFYTNGIIYSKSGYIGPSEYVGKYEEPMKHAGPETLPKKDSSSEIKDKAKKLSSKEVKEDYPNTEFSGSSWALYKWEPVNDLDNPYSLKMDYWTDAVTITKEIENNEDISIDPASFVTMDIPSMATAVAPRTDTSTYPWPGFGAEVSVFGKNTKGLTELMDEDFKKEDLCSVEHMKQMNMYYIFNNK